MKRMTAIINDIIPFSSVDGPGNRTVVFFQGCNFNCSYCHNKETISLCKNCGVCVEFCENEALIHKDNKVTFNREKCSGCDCCIKACPNSSTPKGRKITVEELFNTIKEYTPFISGITVSGGECTLWNEFLIELFKLCKGEGLSCLIDSNGSNNFKEMKELLDLSDGVMLDIKSWDNNIHKAQIGESNEIVKENFLYLLERNKLKEVRTVILIDDFNNEETVNEVSRILGKKNENVRYKLIKFRSHGVRRSMKDKKAPDDGYMMKLKNIAEKNNCKNILIV